MGLGETYNASAGTMGQIEEAHTALDEIDIPPSILSSRVLVAVRRVKTLEDQLTKMHEKYEKNS